MSFIGPRPLLMEFLKWYSPEQMRRHDVKPGVTGWAQVQGRHAILFSKRLELDVWYVDNRSLALDLKILGLTVLKVLTMRGAQPAQSDAEVDDVGLHDAVRRERGLVRRAFLGAARGARPEGTVWVIRTREPGAASRRGARVTAVTGMRWEVGGEFNLPVDPPGPHHRWPEGAVWYGLGRHALQAL